MASNTVIKWVFLITILIFSIEIISMVSLLVLQNVRHVHYSPILADEIAPEHKEVLERLTNKKTTYTAYSRKLGWTIKKNGLHPLYRANSDGIRSDEEFEHHSSNAVVRVASFGDSFTHGDEVKNSQTWQTQMMENEPKLEVLNFGVGGYGLDQAYLRYMEDGSLFAPDIVFIGFMSENISRNVNVYRPFYFPKTGGPFTKPRFVIRDKELELQDNPFQSLNDYDKLLRQPDQVLPALGINDYHYQNLSHKSRLDLFSTVRFLKIMYRIWGGEKIYVNGFYNENSAPFDLTVKIFDSFVETSLNNSSLPIIIVFPFRDDLNRYGMSREKSYQPLLDYFKENGYLYVDIMNAFSSLGGGHHVDEFFLDAHYSPLGNKIVAEYLSNILKKNNLTNKQSVYSKLQNYKKQKK